MTVFVRNLLTFTISLSGLVLTWAYCTYVDFFRSLARNIDELTISLASTTKVLHDFDIFQLKWIFTATLLYTTIYYGGRLIHQKRYIVHLRLWVNRQLWHDWEAIILLPMLVVTVLVASEVYG
jgi:hypothetical protein